MYIYIDTASKQTHKHGPGNGGCSIKNLKQYILIHISYRKVPAFGDDYYRSIDRPFDYVGYLTVQVFDL